MRENSIVEKNDMTLSVDLVDLKNVKDKDPKYLEPCGFFFLRITLKGNIAITNTHLNFQRKQSSFTVLASYILVLISTQYI